jgi:hypothetical protein
LTREAELSLKILVMYVREMKLDIYCYANTGVTPKSSILYYAYDVLLIARSKFLAHLLAEGFGRGWPGYTPEKRPSVCGSNYWKDGI